MGVFLWVPTSTSLHLGLHLRARIALKSHHKFPSVHDPTLLPSLTQQVPSRWALEIKNYRRSNCLLRSPRREQPLLRKANKEPLTTTAWDTDSYLSGRIKPRPQTHRNLGIAFRRGNSHLPLLRPVIYSPDVEGWIGLVKNGNRWLSTTQKLDMGLVENRDNLFQVSTWILAWLHQVSSADHGLASWLWWEKDEHPSGQWETQAWGSESEMGGIDQPALSLQLGGRFPSSPVIIEFPTILPSFLSSSWET